MYENITTNPMFAIAAVCISVFTDNLAYGVIIPVLPAALLKDPNVPDQQVQAWLSLMLALYGLILLIFSPIFGYASDRFHGRKPLLLTGLSIMIFSLVLFMLFERFPVILVSARALQGMSSAAVGVGGLALISDNSGPNNAAFGASFMVLSVFLSAAVSPFLGGILYDNFGYEAVFVVPIILIGLSMLMLMLTDTQKGQIPLEPKRFANKQEASQRLDEQDHDAHRSPSTPIDEETPLLIDILAQPASHHSLFDLLRQKRTISGVFTLTICISVFAALETTLPMFLMKQFLWSPTETGLLFLITSVPKIICPFAGKLVDRYGARIPTGIALVVSSTFMICLCVIRNASLANKVILVSCLTLNNTAAAVTETAMIAEIGMLARIEGLAAQGGALVNMSLASGLMLGPLIGGFVFERFGWSSLTITLSVVWLVCLPGVLWFAGCDD